MSVTFDDSHWEYWMRIEFWNTHEAAFILDGIIPSARTMYDYGFGAGDQPILKEPDTDTFLALLRRKFVSKQIKPKECLEWAIGAGISLDEKLMATAIKCKVLPKLNLETNKGEPNDQKQSGKHWAEMRVKILHKAVKFLNSPPEGYVLFHKKDHRINITQLRDAIVDHGHDLVWENGKNAGADMIYQTIQEAIKGKSKSQKTRD